MKVVLGGIVKNIEKNIPSMYDFISRLKACIPSLEVCIYENNSTDTTKSLLKSSEFIEVVCEDYDESFFLTFPGRTYDNKGCRIHKIAYARNQLLKMVEKKELTQDDFFILIDFDFTVSPDVKVISFVLEKFPKEADVLFANGIQHNGHYYDAYEYRSNELPFGPEILGEPFWSDSHMAKIQKQIHPQSDFIPVVSAFGGLAIYRANIIKDCTYSADVTDELHEFYSSFSIQDPNPQTHNSGCSLGCYLKDMKIFYKNNSGYNYPVAAEHVNFHHNIRKKGFTHMFICPFLLYYWST